MARVILAEIKTYPSGKMGQTWTPPSWMYHHRHPPNDDAYFEIMARVIFMAGLNWNVINQKWLDFRKAFKDFSIDEVAKFDQVDIERLVSDPTIVRNRAKIVAVIENAKKFIEIRRKYGTFKAYFDTLDKSNNYVQVTKDLVTEFKRLGPSSARIFLYSIGEGIEPS